LRELVLSVAKETRGVGKREETLKWGEPSFQAQYPTELEFEGNRTIIFDTENKIPTHVIKDCLKQAILITNINLKIN